MMNNIKIFYIAVFFTIYCLYYLLKTATFDKYDMMNNINIFYPAVFITSYYYLLKIASFEVSG